jgi:hypothetical protein
MMGFSADAHTHDAEVGPTCGSVSRRAVKPAIGARIRSLAVFATRRQR